MISIQKYCNSFIVLVSTFFQFCCDSQIYIDIRKYMMTFVCYCFVLYHPTRGVKPQTPILSKFFFFIGTNLVHLFLFLSFNSSRVGFFFHCCCSISFILPLFQCLCMCVYIEQNEKKITAIESKSRMLCSKSIW